MEEDPSTLPAGTLLAGKFRVVRCLGVGGMGAVYEIEHELTKHRRALKLLHAAMTHLPSVVERFLREASAAGRVGNPHIIESFDAGTLDTGEPYLVMEMLRGETLSARISRGPMPVADVVDLVGQACDGVQAAHDAGIVHRDLKPDNLFVVELDGHAFVKILDFGISKFDPSKMGGSMQLTQEGSALGTPYYMSPEQIRGEANLDARADVYALGVILYECLAGNRPFDAESLTQLAVLIHTGNPAPLAQHRTDLPPGLADVVSRAMATDRAVRTPTAGQLRSELARFGHVPTFGTKTAYSIRSQLSPTSPTSPASPASPASVAAQSVGMATSAAGVSVRPVHPPERRRSAAPIFVGFGVLGAGAIAALALRGPGTTPHGEPAASSAPAAAALPQEPRAPAAPLPAEPPDRPAAPAPSGSASPARPNDAPRQPPVVAPTLQPPAPPPTVERPARPGGAGAPAPAPAAPKPSRVKDKGLAQDNPFAK